MLSHCHTDSHWKRPCLLGHFLLGLTLICSQLSGCFYRVGFEEPTDELGFEAVPGSSPTIAANLNWTATVTEATLDVSLDFTLQSDPPTALNVEVWVSRDGGSTWTPATSAASSPSMSGLAAGINGTTHTFVWDSMADSGPTRPDVAYVLRLTTQADPGLTSDLTVPVYNRVDVAVAADFSCAINARKQAFCFGSDTSAYGGQLGNGPQDGSGLGPVAVIGGYDFISIATTELDSACAVAESSPGIGYGSVYCWGGNANGEHGNATTVSAVEPTTPAQGLSSVAQVVAGRESFCARTTSGSVYCWGAASRGKLGNGASSGNYNVPQQVSGISAATRLAGNSYAEHICAIEGSAVKCWGRGVEGQLGDGMGVDASSPVSVTVLPTAAVDIAVGQRHSCAVLGDGTLWCWGDNYFGKLGTGSMDFPAQQNTPAQVAGVGDAVAVFTSSQTTFFRRADGSIWAFGCNASGEFQNGTFHASATPIQIETAGAYAVLGGGGYAGEMASCRIFVDGQITCAGQNSYGETGSTVFDWVDTPEPLVSVSGTVDELALAADFDVALQGGAVLAWGSSSWGKQGDGSFTVSPNAELVSGISTAVDVDAAYDSACAVLSSGSILCWGLNDFGQLGNGNGGQSPTQYVASPVAVVGINTAQQVEVGDGHACARLTDGSVLCWGANFNGQLGNGSNTPSSVPVSVSLPGGAIDLALGRWFSCALLSGGNAYCWGNNDFGQLGNGSFSSASTPQSVSGLSGYDEIEAAGFYACALETGGGTARCWGNGYGGQLGSGSISNASTPVSFGSLGGIIQMDLGAGTCALLSDGTAQCYGTNAFGAMGTASYTNLSPVTLPWTGIQKLSSASTRCAQFSGGNWECMGRNLGGVLGDGNAAPEFDAFLLPGFPE